MHAKWEIGSCLPASEVQGKGRELNLAMDDQKKMPCAVWNNRNVGGSDHMAWLRFQVNERR
ncbi:hypothetical protein DY000_02040633 [Brassica cretica]|uniref:Uncharacterized protein n=1 Tax=Brassica cretica TaxID=69181 RepID=A0ABQ7BH36_BRACR|nr:hypothetical protein DY000_02040633 [Brassica cretica]